MQHSKDKNTVKRRYNTVQYNMISHIAQQWLKQNILPFTNDTPYLTLTG